MKIILFLLALLLGAVDLGYTAEPCIKHKFVLGKSDGADDAVVQPSDWNDCHVEPPKTLTFTIGCPTCAVLATTDDYPAIWLNDTERTLTITQVTCKSDAGTPTINLQRDDGSAANIFTSAMTCDTTPSGTDGTDGILTSSGFVSGENVLSPGHWLGFLSVTPGGTAKMVTVSIKMTVTAP